jgi:hypothetical protein
LNTETKTIQPTTIAKFFGIVHVTNSTDHTLDVQADQIETQQGTKYTILLTTPEPTPEPTPQPEELKASA